MAQIDFSPTTNKMVEAIIPPSPVKMKITFVHIMLNKMLAYIVCKM